MEQILTLASDFIEHMSNPAYGLRVNEDYSLRFAALLSSEEFPGLLGREVTRLEDPSTLSPHGWLWLLGWARSEGIPLKDSLLLHLTETWSSVFMQVAAIDLATRHVEWKRRDSVDPLQKFRHPFLRKLMTRCTYADDEESRVHKHVQTARAESLLVALMQVGTDITLDAASALLNHPWTGRPFLVDFFWSLCSELDEETREIWVSRLRPPKRQSHEHS